MEPSEVAKYSQSAREWAKKITGWGLAAALPAGISLPDGTTVTAGDNGAQINYGNKLLFLRNTPKFSNGKSDVVRDHPDADLVYLRPSNTGSALVYEFRSFTRDNFNRAEYCPATLIMVFPPGEAEILLDQAVASPGLLKSLLAAKFPEIGKKVDVQKRSELIKIEPDIEPSNYRQKFTLSKY